MGRAAVCAGGRRPAREIATRELRSECSISRPALALPPPTGTAARLRRPRGGLQSGGACGCEWPALALPPPTGAAATSLIQCGPSGALHTSGAGCADGWLGASSRSLARPRRHCGGLRVGLHGRCPAVSHAIPPGHVACPYHFMSLSHSCSGIACDFGEGAYPAGRKWGESGVCRWDGSPMFSQVGRSLSGNG